MDDGKGIIVVKLEKCPITYRRKIYARLSRVNETARRFRENLAFFISYEVAVPADRGHASHGAVWSQRLRSFVFKPLIKSEHYKFHIKLMRQLSHPPQGDCSRAPRSRGVLCRGLQGHGSATAKSGSLERWVRQRRTWLTCEIPRSA